jgi:transcriptional regulator with XRE-family HTH domain
MVSSLVAARTAAGLTQDQLAARLHCHQSLIARIESGQRRVDVPELILLCRAPEIEPAVVFEDVDRAVPVEARI